MKNKYYTNRDPLKRYFPLPNEVFDLGLSPGALAVYSYLMYIEDRTTYQCHASYRTIGNAVNMSPNTVRKYVTELGRAWPHSNGTHDNHHAGRPQAERKPFVHASSHSVLHPAVLRAETRKTGRGMRAGTRPKTAGSVPTGTAEKRLSARVSRVSRLCPIFRSQPGAYPPETGKTDVAPVCGRTENSTETQRSGFGRKRRCSGMDETCRTCGKRGNTPKRAKSDDFGRCGEKAG